MGASALARRRLDRRWRRLDAGAQAGPRRRPDQDGHRHRHHRRDRAVGQRQLAGGAVHRRADQQGGRHRRPPDRALPRGHRVRSQGRRRQRPQADPGTQGQRRAGRHHLGDAPGDQGPDRQSRPHALHLSAALRRAGMHQAPLLHRPDAGAAVRQAHSLPDQDRGQEALRHAVGQLRLAAASEQVRPQGHRGQRRRGRVRGILSARPGRIFRDHRQDPRRQGRLRVQHRDPARPAAVLQAALRIGLPEERRRARAASTTTRTC